MPINRFISAISKISHKVARLLFTRDVATFILCLFLAFVFWIMHSSGSRREMSFVVGIKYVAVPPNVHFIQDLPQSVRVNVRDHGNNLMRYYFKGLDSITVDLNNLIDGNGRLESSVSNYISGIQSQLTSKAQILTYEPNVIESYYLMLNKKRVPVELIQPVTLESQFILKDSIVFLPDSVVVFGTKDDLKDIHVLYTDAFDGTLNKTETRKLKLQKPNENIRLRRQEVQVTVPVEMQTEKSVKIPVTIEHLPEDLKFISFPKYVTIHFGVGLSRYEDITLNDFSIVLDYNKLKRSASTVVPLSLSKMPTGLSSVQIAPKEVEFVLEEK